MVLVIMVKATMTTVLAVLVMVIATIMKIHWHVLFHHWLGRILAFGLFKTSRMSNWFIRYNIEKSVKGLVSLMPIFNNSNIVSRPDLLREYFRSCKEECWKAFCLRWQFWFIIQVFLVIIMIFILVLILLIVVVAAANIISFIITVFSALLWFFSHYERHYYVRYFIITNIIKLSSSRYWSLSLSPLCLVCFTCLVTALSQI